MSEEHPTEGHRLFWQAAVPFLERDGVTRSTMMGFPCLRVNGDFFASVHREGTGITVKLPRDRVAAAVADGSAESFAPNGKVFKEWLFVPVGRAGTWPAWLEEAFVFVAG
jgi:hypothetical protein